MNNITTTLVPVEDVKNEFNLYLLKLNDLEVYFDSLVIFLLSSKYSYFTLQQNKLFKEIMDDDLSVSSLIDHIDILIKEKQIPERYKPKVLHPKLSQRYRLSFMNSKWKYVHKEYKHKQSFISAHKRYRDLPAYSKTIYEPDFKIYRYNMVLISLIEQRQLLPEKYITFLKEYTKKEGIPFDDYVDNMVKKAMTNYWDWSLEKPRTIKCERCGEVAINYAKQMCELCYRKEYKKEYKKTRKRGR